MVSFLFLSISSIVSSNGHVNFDFVIQTKSIYLAACTSISYSKGSICSVIATVSSSQSLDETLREKSVLAITGGWVSTVLAVYLTG